MRLTAALCAMLALPVTAQALDAAAVRGGWVAEEGGSRQVYLLIVRGDVLTGTHCADCSQPRNLGFIDGRVEADGVRFVIRHEEAAGRMTLDDARGVLKDQALILTLQRRGAAASRSLALHRVPPPASGAAPPPRRPPVQYVPPGPPQPLTAAKVTGLWLFGAGPGKQYFIIRRAGPGLLGLVCGPCDNPWSMAPLDGFVLHGTDLTFNIVHEDTGGAVEHGPFNNVAQATLAANELHLKVIPSYAPESAPIEMTLLGPVSWQP